MDELTETHQLSFECGQCKSVPKFYRGLYQSDTGEVVVTWNCGKCKGRCMAIIAGMKPTLPFFTANDVDFLSALRVKA